MKTSRSQGFTLIELMIVIAIIAIIAAIAIPNLLEAKRLSNEKTTASTIRSIYTAQLTFKEKLSKDQDNDTEGEFAVDWLELSGDNAGGALQPDAIGDSMVNMIPDPLTPAHSRKNGYIFQIFTSVDAGAQDDDDDESEWSCMAWPKKYGKTGYGCFAVTDEGIIYNSSNPVGAYDGAAGAMILADLYGVPFDNTTVPAGAAGFTIYSK